METMRLFTVLITLGTVAVSAASFGGSIPAAFAAIKPISIGDKVPFVDLDWGFPPQKVNIPRYTWGRSVIIVGVPGAFTPVASNKVVPSYLENQAALKEQGVEEVIFYSVNDGAVMRSWFNATGANGTMSQMFGDPSGEFTRDCGMELVDPELVAKGLVGRSKAFAMHVVSCVVQHVAVCEDNDPFGDVLPEAVCATAMLEAIKSKQVVI
jgi:peroxiredoxin